MTINRTPLVTSSDPEIYSNGIITAGSTSLNVLYTQYPGNKLYASQRPAVNVTTDPSEAGQSASLGRGITFWDLVGDFYFVRGDELYKGDYNNLIHDIGATARDKVYFAEVGTFLIIIDPESNRGWFIDESSPETVIEITATDFPPNQTPTLQLAGGAVSLDGYLFVMTTDGRIWNSNLNDPTAWTAIDFLTADVSPDGGVAIVKHHNHVCAIGTSSIEFFYDAGNPVGSPLQLRQDISFLTGAVEFNAISTTGENIIFLGREATGTIGLYRLESFKLRRVSNDSIDRFIGNTYTTQATNGNDLKFIVSSSWFGQHLLCFITSVAIDNIGTATYNPEYTLMYDAVNDLWGQFDTELSLIDQFGVVDATDATGATGIKGSLMFLSGAVASVDVSGTTSDYTTSDEYFVDDYMVDGYMVSAPDDAANNICFNITTVEYDFDTITRKNQYRMSVVGTTIAPSGDLTPLEVSWTDDRYRSFSTARELDTGLRRSLTRGGNFRRRAYAIDYCGADQLRLEALELDTRASQYA